MQVTSSSTSPMRQLWIQRRQALSEMIGSIQSGNIAAAQKDLAQVRQADSGLGLNPAPAPAPSGSYGVRNRIDFSALFSAVQSGDLNAAQDAWSQIEQSRPTPAGAADNTSGPILPSQDAQALQAGRELLKQDAKPDGTDQA